jgi:ribose transport system permease protein
MTESTTTAPAVARRPIDFRRLLRRHGWTVGVYVLLLVLVLYWRASTVVAWGPFDVQTLALDLVPLAFAACGQAIVIISGGIDLSIGSLMALINVLAARWMVHMSFREALLYSLLLVLVGALAGALTGLVIVLTRVADIIVTLAMLFIWYGAALAVLALGGGAPEGFVNLTQVDTWGTTWLPAGLAIMLVAVAIIWVPIRRSRAGLALYAVGSNRSAAFLAGVNVSLARIGAYALGGTFAALGGLAITSGSGGLGDANAGATSGFTLQSVAAAVLGGVSLLGGVGGVIGPIAAACSLKLVPTILILKGQDPGWATVIQGVLIVVVMMIGGLALRQKGKTGT